MSYLARTGALRSLPRSFEGLLGSIGVVLSSNLAVALLTFGTFALTTRALSLTELGVLVLIEAYGRVFDQALRLEPTQALIRMGMNHRDDPQAPPFRRLVRFGFLLDFGGSIFAAALALACLPLVGPWFGFDAGAQRLAAIYCLTLLVPAPMTANALFRLFGRFGLYSRISVLTVAFRLVATAALYAAGLGFQAFVLLLCADSVISRLAPTIRCWPLLRRNAGPGVLREPLAGLRRDHPGLWHFILASNLNVLARNSTRQFDVAALGGFVSPAELSFYVLAKRFAMLVIRLGTPVQLVVYPRMCELVAKGRLGQLSHFVGAFSLALLGMFACGLAVFALVSQPLVAWVFGPDFVAAIPNILVQLAGASLFLTGKVLASALQAVHRVGQLLTVSIITAAVFFVPIPLLVPHYGVMAASWLGLAVGVVWLGACAWAFARAIRSLRDAPAARRDGEFDLAESGGT